YLSLFLVYTPHTEIYTLSLHDALPISNVVARKCWKPRMCGTRKIKPHSPYTTDGTVASMSMRYPSQVANLRGAYSTTKIATPRRSEEHTSELQSRGHLVCRLLLEKKK